MRKGILAAGAVLVLVVANVGIYRHERTLARGSTVFLELAPVDPRSLMQGDYMALRFRVADDAFGERLGQAPRDGRLVLAIDAAGIGTFRRFDDGTAIRAGEVVMQYRIRGDQPRFATDAFFFREGHASYYEGARYGEFRVAPNGEALLVALRGDRLEVLGSGLPPVTSP